MRHTLMQVNSNPDSVFEFPSSKLCGTYVKLHIIVFGHMKHRPATNPIKRIIGFSGKHALGFPLLPRENKIRKSFYLRMSTSITHTMYIINI